jgi:hypothetical protein
VEIQSADQVPEGIEVLLRTAETLPHGTHRIAICEEAVRKADLLNDVRLAYRARIALVDSTMLGSAGFV